MRQILLTAIILFSFSFIFGQRTEVPLTQAEYVKMLYDIQKNPSAKQDLIDAIRRRGLGFELNPGLRSLTMSKSRNDAELKRTLEEGDRRRQNPTAAKLPSETEAREIIEKTRKNTLEAVEEMPDFVVKQLINRKTAFAGTNNWKTLDRLAIAVSYSSEKGEQYKVLAINGNQVNAEKGSNYAGLDGASTRGEFVEVLARIFRPETKTEFSLIDSDLVRNQQALIFEYKITVENNKNGGIGAAIGKSSYVSTPAGHEGKIWIDKNSFRVLKIDYSFTDIPANFPIKAVKQNIDYSWVTIAEQKYLLPVQSDTTFTSPIGGEMIQDQNVIRFKDYQKYGTDVIVEDDDTEEVPQEETKSNP